MNKSMQNIIRYFLVLSCLITLAFFWSPNLANAVEFKKEDQATLTRDEPLYFQGIAFKQGAKGDVFTVIAHRADTKTVYVSAKDASGREIALTITETALSLAVPADIQKPPPQIPSNPSSSIRKPSPEEATYLITTDKGSGSGFLGQYGGRVFLFTNYHVLEGATKVTCANVQDSFAIANGDALWVSWPAPQKLIQAL